MNVPVDVGTPFMLRIIASASVTTRIGNERRIIFAGLVDKRMKSSILQRFSDRRARKEDIRKRSLIWYCCYCCCERCRPSCSV
jgi:hypothetical protein